MDLGPAATNPSTEQDKTYHGLDRDDAIDFLVFMPDHRLVRHDHFSYMWCGVII